MKVSRRHLMAMTRHVFIRCGQSLKNTKVKHCFILFNDKLLKNNYILLFKVNSEKNIYLNTKSKGLKQGLIFGYSQLKPILKIDSSFYAVEHESNKNDAIISVEVWGCGSKKATFYQRDIKAWENKNKEKMRTAKIDAEWSDNADKVILELAGIKTEYSERGDL